MTKKFLLTAALIPALALAACSSSDEKDTAGEVDPATGKALNDQIMVNPDLANQNEAGAALSGAGDQSIPAENMTPEAIQKAKDEAFALVGGSDGMKTLPAPKQFGAKIPETSALSAAAKAALAPEGRDCGGMVKYSAAWAAKLPAIFPVYPRGATKEAAGVDSTGCNLRVVTFLTAVPLEDVLTFYHSRALTGGYSSEYSLSDGDNIVSGTKGKSAYVVYGRKLESGLTEIDLITSGK